MNNATARSISTPNFSHGGPTITIDINQGEFDVSSSEREVFTTILGSCVSICLFDPEQAIGGMNHILLPSGSNATSSDMVYGVQSMELLINAMIKRGGMKNRLEAKVFGGADMLGGLSTVGNRNAKFAADFLKSEDIPVVSESLGGDQARRIRFWPASGKVKQLLLNKENKTYFRDTPPPPPPAAPAGSGDIELF